MASRIVAALVVAALSALTLTPVADSAGSLARRTAQALRIANRADRNATIALRRTAVAGPEGAVGATGPRGEAGQAGSTGARGQDGASVVGPVGKDGAPGANGTVPRPVSVTNDAGGVLVQTSPTTVVHAPVTLTSAGWVMVTATAQLLAEGPAEQVRCHVDVDGREVADAYQPVSAGGSEQVVVQAVVGAALGAHDVALTCSKSATVSSVEVPLSRGSLAVVVGG